MQVSTQRTRLDWAHGGRELVDVHYPEPDRIVLVMDHFKTHSPASLYTAFPPAEAKRIADRLETYYTRKHGSWLNMAEIDLSILQRQCPGQRFADRAAMDHAVQA